MPRAEPFSVWAAAAASGRLRADDTIEHDGRLAHEKFEDFPLQPAVAQRHALEMVLVDDGRLSIAVGGGR